MGCDYNIIDYLEKFAIWLQKNNISIANFMEICLKYAWKYAKLEVVANWVIMIMFGPRAEHDHDHQIGVKVADWVIMAMFRPRAEHDHNHPVGDAAAAAGSHRALRARPGPPCRAQRPKHPKVPASGQGRGFF